MTDRHDDPLAGRGWLETRVRQARNPPPPVFRAVVANMAVAIVGAVVLVDGIWLAARMRAFPTSRWA